MTDNRIRIPILPITYNREYDGKPGELILDIENSDIYIKDMAGLSNIKIPNSNMIDDAVILERAKLLGNVGVSENTLKKVNDQLIPLLEWKDSITNNGSVYIDSVTDILNAFKNIKVSDGTLSEQISKKVDLINGKILSDNDFTDMLLNTLNSIEDGSNNYKHPEEKTCSYSPPVKSINGKTGNVKLTKADILGLEDVDPDANNYIHPTTQICNYTFPVKTLGGKSGKVIITKNDIGLDLVQNLKIATVENILDLNLIEEYYMTPKTLYTAICQKLFGILSPNDGRYGLKINLIPYYAKVTFLLRPYVETGENYTEWTNGVLYRLPPGKYEYRVETTEEWQTPTGTIDIIDSDLIIDIVLDDIETFFVTILNANGPSIVSAYIYEEPYTNAEMMSTDNGRTISNVLPGVNYRYIIQFGDGIPDATGEFNMPFKDYFIIHLGGGTDDDQGHVDIDDIFPPPPTAKGNVAINIIPSDALLEVYDNDGVLITSDNVFEIEFYKNYTYIITKDGYLSESDTINLQPWEESLNVDINLKGLKPLHVKVNPITIDNIVVKININGMEVEVPKIDEYNSQTVYPNGIVDGSTDGEYAIHELDGVPPGIYDYIVELDGVKLVGGSITHTFSGSDTRINLSTNMNRYYKIIPDITPISAVDRSTFLISEDGIIFDVVDKVNGYKLYGTGKDIWVEVEHPDYKNFSTHIQLKYTAISKGGVINVPIKMELSNDKYTDVTETQTDGVEPTLNDNSVVIVDKNNDNTTGRLIVEVVPYNANLIIGDVSSTDIIYNNKKCKECVLNYHEEYKYDISLSGFISESGTIVKNKDVVGIDKTIVLTESDKCTLLVNPITVDSVKVQLMVSGSWTDITKTEEIIQSLEYTPSSTDNEYSVYSANSLVSGDYVYRVLSNNIEIKTGKISHDIKGSKHIINLENVTTRHYGIHFNIYSKNVALSNVIVEIKTNGIWSTTGDNNCKIYGTNNVDYRVVHPDYITYLSQKTFKEIGNIGGGKVDIDIHLTETSDDIPVSSNSGLKSNQRAFNFLITPIDSDVRIEGLDRKFYVNGELRSESYYNADNSPKMVRLNSMTIFQDIIAKYDNTPDDYKGISIKVSKPGFNSIEKILSWNDIKSSSSLHETIILSEIIDIECKVYPITIDDVEIKLISEDETVNLIRGIYDSEYLAGNSLSEYNKYLKDNQYIEYIKNTGKYKNKVAAGCYKYDVIVAGDIVQSNTVLLNNESNNISIRLDSNINRYYLLDFDISDSNGDKVSIYKISIYNESLKEWIPIKGKSYKHFSNDKHITYCVESDGYITYTDIVKLYHESSIGGCKIKVPVTLEEGVSVKPINIADMSPSDTILPVGNKYVRFTAIDKIDKPISGSNITISGIAKRIVFDGGIMYSEFILKDNTNYNISVTGIGFSSKSININSNGIKLKLIKDGYYGIILDKLGDSTVNIHPITIDNVKIGVGKYTDNEDEISLIDEFTQVSETLTNFENDNIRTKEFRTYTVNGLSDNIDYGYYVYINNFLVDIIKPTGNITNIDLGSNRNRYFDIRLNICDKVNGIKLNVTAFTLIKNKWDYIEIDKIRINSVSEDIKLKLVCEGYDDEIFVINPKFAKDAIHDGRVVLYNINMNRV